MPVPRPHTASATGTNTFEPRQTTTMQGVFVVLADLDIGSNTEDGRANDRSSTNARSTSNVNSDVPMLIETLLQRSNPANRANTDTRNSNPFLANVGQPMVFRLPPPGPGYSFASTSRRSSSASNVSRQLTHRQLSWDLTMALLLYRMRLELGLEIVAVLRQAHKLQTPIPEKGTRKVFGLVISYSWCLSVAEL